MTTYYVRKSGSDTNTGLSPASAFATVGKLIGASGVMVSGDTAYVGAGVYREQITVTPTFTSTTQVLGDVDGAQTGDPGEVRITAYTTFDLGTGSASAINLNNKNFLTMARFVMQSLGQSPTVSNAGGHDWNFADCAFFDMGGQGCITGTFTVDVTANVVIDRCYFLSNTATNADSIQLVAPTSTVADYDLDVIIRNCKAVAFLSNAKAFVLLASSGGNSFKPGGVLVQYCSVFGLSLMQTTGSTSTTIPCQVNGSFHLGSQAPLIAAVLGQIVEDDNVMITAAARTNVSTGPRSVLSTNLAVLPSIGQEAIWGGPTQQLGSFGRDSMLSAWSVSAVAPPAIDILSRLRPSGGQHILSVGTLTAATATTATDSGASWGRDAFNGAVIKITGGTGSGQVKIIRSHTPNTITTCGNWATTPDATSTYVIYFGNTADSFKPTGNTNTTNATATLASGTWVTNMWLGFTAVVAAGTGVGQSQQIISNTSNVLTFNSTWATPLDTTSLVVIARTASGADAINPAVGALELHNTARRETLLVDAGGVCYGLDGWTDQDYRVPVNAGVTVTVTVKTSFTTDHGNTTKPRLVLVANGEIGVAAQVATAVGTAGAGTFETLSITFTPTARGIATLRFQARSSKPGGYASFDTVNVQ